MHGRRHNHVFHLVAINGRKARDAKPMETLGVYDPAMKLGEKNKSVEWSVNRIKYWLGVGALPSKTVVRLLEVVSHFQLVYTAECTLNYGPIQGGVIPPDSKYHPKALGPRLPLPTVPLDSLKARTLWDSHLGDLSESLTEEISKGPKGHMAKSLGPGKQAENVSLLSSLRPSDVVPPPT